MTKTRFGRYVYAVGSNEKAARLTGINVKLMKVAIFTITGVPTGLAGFLYITRGRRRYINLPLDFSCGMIRKLQFKLKQSIEDIMEDYAIQDAETLAALWSKTYNTEGKPDWSHILPYYDEAILFRDSIQEISGIKAFTEMTERLAARSKDLKMKVVRAVKEKDTVFIEWEMTISYKKNPSSVIFGASRISLNERGRIQEQRDYYDLWGDIFDNIPRFGKTYRKFMRKKFG